MRLSSSSITPVPSYNPSFLADERLPNVDSVTNLGLNLFHTPTLFASFHEIQTNFHLCQTSIFSMILNSHIKLDHPPFHRYHQLKKNITSFCISIWDIINWGGTLRFVLRFGSSRLARKLLHQPAVTLSFSLRL